MLFVDIEKCIGNFTLKVCFETNNNVVSLLGASGSGKSMTLKCIAGIETPDKGRIVLNNRVLFDSEKGINISTQNRRVGYLFQQYALFPDMSVKQNIEVALIHLSKKVRPDVVNQALKQFKLKEIENKKPCELSGGEMQRTALARLMVNSPEVILLDEPFSAIDDYSKWQILVDFKKTIDGFDKDVVLVTHDIDEVIALSDTVCVLSDGISENVTKVNEALSRPKSVSAAKLFGCRNFSKIEVRVHSIDAERCVCVCKDWNTEFEISFYKSLEYITHVGIFPEDVVLARTDSSLDREKEREHAIRCTVSQILRNRNGEEAVLCVDGTETYLYAMIPSDYSIKVNDTVNAYVDPEKLLVLEG